MKKQLPFYCAVFLICVVQTSAQNLVPNPGFEIALKNPIYAPSGQNKDSFWFTHIGSPDFYHAAYQDLSQPPETLRGFQEPASGVGMAGIIASPSIEFITVALTEVLEGDEIYDVSFKVNLSGMSGIASDGIGLRFLEEDPRETPPSGGYDLRNARGNIIRDTTGWTLVKGQYLSKGNERFLMIGNLPSDRGLKTEKLLDDAFEGTYFFIDDVSVASCHTSGVASEIIDTIICEGTEAMLSGMSDAVSHQWESEGTDQTIEISESGTYIVNNHYDCSVDQQVFNVEVGDCDCTIEVPNLILSGTRLRIWKSLNVDSYEFFLVDGTGTYVARTTDQLFRSAELPLEAGAYFWQARLSCYGVADQLRDKMVSGKFVVQ